LPVLLGLIAIPAIAVAVFWMPGILFAAYLLIPTYKAVVQPWLPLDLTVGLAAINAVQLFAVLRYRRVGLSRRSVIVWLGIAAVITAGALYAQDQSSAVARVGQWWLLVVAPLMAAPRVAMKRAYLLQFLGAIAIVSLIAITLAITQTPALPTDERLSVLGDNTIQSARAVLLLPLIAAAYFLGMSGSSSWLALPLLPIGAYGAVATGSRGPLLAFVATIAMLIVGTTRGRQGSGRILVFGAAGILTVAALLAAVSFLPSASLQRIGLLFASIGGDTTPGGSIDTRASLFGLAVSAFEAHPLIGVGTGGFATIARDTVTFAGYEYPHNTVLQFAAELGIVGASLAVYIVALALLARTPQTVAWLAVRALGAFYVLNALVSGALYDERMLWGLLFLLLCAPVPAAATRLGHWTTSRE
jgi:O-antigen ligase